jgi:hypothetical protein
MFGKYCFKFGLYKQGILHDLSKFTPTEFWTSVRYYQGNRSPINAEKDDKGYSEAWMHHYHRNKHHWMYWVDFDNEQNLIAYKIPYKYVIEAIADWIAAGIVYEKDKFTWSEPYEFYKKYTRIDNETSERIFHFQTRQLWDTILVDLKVCGIEYVTSLIKNGTYKNMYETNKTSDGKFVIANLEEYNRLVSKYYM